MIVELVTPNGTVVALDDPDGQWLRTGPVDGVGMPPTSTSSTPIFDEPGEWFNSLRFTPRTMHVPMAVTSPDGLDDLVVAHRTFLSLLRPSFRVGQEHKLRFTLGDGTAREIACRYDSGWSGAIPQYDYIGDDWIADVLTFRALDPMFYDVDDNVFSTGATLSRKYFPMFADPNNVGPHLTSSNVFGDFQVSNAGDLVAWPVIRVDGPGTGLRIESDTLGTVLDLSGNGGLVLASGEYVVIDTRPGFVSITKNDGTNVFNYLTDDSSIWPIDRGEQTIRVDMAGTSPASAIEVRFKQRYLTV